MQTTLDSIETVHLTAGVCWLQESELCIWRCRAVHPQLLCWEPVQLQPSSAKRTRKESEGCVSFSRLETTQLDCKLRDLAQSCCECGSWNSIRVQHLTNLVYRRRSALRNKNYRLHSTCWLVQVGRTMPSVMCNDMLFVTVSRIQRTLFLQNAARGAAALASGIL